MDQIQPDETSIAQSTVGNEESSIIEAQPIENQSLDLTGNQQLNDDNDVSNSQNIENIDSTPQNLIQGSESLSEDLSFQKAAQDPPLTDQEPNCNESVVIIEPNENAEQGTLLDNAPSDTISNSYPKEDMVINNNQEELAVNLTQQNNFQREEVNQNLINSFEKNSEASIILEKKVISKDAFINLDIPKPDFSSSSDEETDNIRPPPLSSDDDSGPVNFEDVLRPSSFDETSQEKILNQSTQRINAPQQFIPSSQLMMTKQALQEGNSFLRGILNKLKSINQFLQEKTSKILA